jgi:superfamily I DNA/RNA helicase
LDLESCGEGWPLGFFRYNLAAEHTDKKKVASAIGKFEYIENVIERSKAQALIEPPRITVGTIHSVKGGEASVVYLFPDLSKPQKEDWDGWNGVGEFGKENLIRLFYVAMTRAKQHLVVAASDSKSWGTADLWRYMNG